MLLKSLCTFLLIFVICLDVVTPQESSLTDKLFSDLKNSYQVLSTNNDPIIASNSEVSKGASNGDIITTSLTFYWSGGDAICNTCGTDQGIPTFPTTAFACSSNLTSNTSAGNWNNGVQIFMDPLYQNPDKKLYVLSQVALGMVGVFDCGDGPSTTFYVSLQDTAIKTEQRISGPCQCGNCAEVLNYTTIEMPSGWPNYVYGGNNTLKVIVSSGTVCVTTIELAFIYSQALLPVDSSSNDKYNDLLLWGSIWCGVLLFLCFILLVLLLVQRWRSANSHLKMEDEEESVVNEGNTGNELFKINGNEIKLGPRIGKGSYGDVYRAEWRGIFVAVKKLPLHLLEDQQFLKDFNREALLMSSLRHPHILQFLGSCVIDRDLCIITEYMAKGSVYKLLHDDSFDLPYSMIKRWAIDTSQGMLYLHQSNPPIIHRDLKSHNLLVDDSFRLKISDFGLSKVLDNYNRTMTSCGTASWAAPEVLRNQKYSESADVYSFAMCLWEFWTRKDPYEGMSSYQIIFAVGTEGLRPLIPNSCPTDYAKLIVDCWANDPSQRPNFSQIIDRIKQLQ